MKYISNLKLHDMISIGIVVFFFTTTISYGKFSLEQLFSLFMLMLLIIGIIQIWGILYNINNNLMTLKELLNKNKHC